MTHEKSYCDEHKLQCKAVMDLASSKDKMWDRINAAISWKVFAWIMGFFAVAIAGSIGYGAATNSLTAQNTASIGALKVEVGYIGRSVSRVEGKLDKALNGKGGSITQ